MDDELLCLTFAVCTETNRLDEVPYVAGVVLNRVRTGYRGDTVREVVLSPYQFSAFNHEHGKPREERKALEAEDAEAAVRAFLKRHRREQLFDDATEICRELLDEEDAENPWLNGMVDHPHSPDVRHYFSPISMRPSTAVPKWFDASREVEVGEIPKSRFRWFHSIP